MCVWHFAHHNEHKKPMRTLQNAPCSARKIKHTTLSIPTTTFLDANPFYHSRYHLCYHFPNMQYIEHIFSHNWVFSNRQIVSQMFWQFYPRENHLRQHYWMSDLKKNIHISRYKIILRRGARRGDALATQNALTFRWTALNSNSLYTGFK